MKTGNEYQRQYPNYEKAPKAVIAAIAVSLAMRLSQDDLAEATAIIDREWRVLHHNGIVKQKPAGRPA